MSRARDKDQLSLFQALDPPSAPEGVIGSATPTEAQHAVAQRLPRLIYLGTSSWSFPGWDGLVYDRTYPQAALARSGLPAYARHPLLRAVGLDRTYYGPLDSAALRAYAQQVPEDFLFLVKAHQWCTLARFPRHRRYAEASGQRNPHWLDPEYATEAVVRPFVEGLGPRGGVVLFQFAPQDERALGGRRGFADNLHRFFGALPVGPRYAVEIRNHKLLTARYTTVLRELGVLHCMSVHPTMPDVRTQAHAVNALEGSALVVRWMLTPHLDYSTARRGYQPFDTLVDPDPRARDAIAELVRAMSAQGRPSIVIINNKAEGCAPRSIAALADSIVKK